MSWAKLLTVLVEAALRSPRPLIGPASTTRWRRMQSAGKTWRMPFAAMGWIALTACTAGMEKTGAETWPLPPRPSGLHAERQGGSVCLPREDFVDLTLYIERLRNSALDNGAVQ